MAAKTMRGNGFCVLCGKSASQVKGSLVQGANGSVCRPCAEYAISLCHERENKEHARAPKLDTKIPTPKEIKAFLDQDVIGQSVTKKALAVAVYSHYTRIFRKNKIPKGHPLELVELSKSNVLLTGPTGVGKTLLAQTLAKMLNVPFAMADATSLTEAGYVGEDVESMLLSLYQNADGDLSRTEMGIVYIDEIDKLARKESGVSITRDVSGEGVQQGLLKIIEGTIAGVPLSGGRKHPNGEQVKINTANILFICGGAFVGMDKIIERRNKGSGGLGFGKTGSAGKSSLRVEPEDLLAFGLIPELIGRLPVVCSLSPLKKEDMLRIMVEPRNALVKQYEKRIMLGGSQLTFTSDAIEEVVRVALERKTGARGLQSVMEDVMGDILFELKPGQNITVTGRVVADALSWGLVA